MLAAVIEMERNFYSSILYLFSALFCFTILRFFFANSCIRIEGFQVKKIFQWFRDFWCHRERKMLLMSAFLWSKQGRL